MLGLELKASEYMVSRDESERTPKALEQLAASFAHFFELKGGYKAPEYLGYTPLHEYLTAADFVEHCLTVSAGVASSWRKRLHERALEAGDRNAVEYEEQRRRAARRARGETLPSTPLSEAELKARAKSVEASNKTLHDNLSPRRPAAIVSQNAACEHAGRYRLCTRRRGSSGRLRPPA